MSSLDRLGWGKEGDSTIIEKGVEFWGGRNEGESMTIDCCSPLLSALSLGESFGGGKEGESTIVDGAGDVPTGGTDFVTLGGRRSTTAGAVGSVVETVGVLFAWL